MRSAIAAAIRTAISGLREGDILLIAGKGHETGQKVGDKTLPFSDQEEARKALRAAGARHERALEDGGFRRRVRRLFAGEAPPAIVGLSIDTRTIGPGEAFVAIRGESRDGHLFVEAALKAGAALAVVAEGKAPKNLAPLLIVPDDPLAALERIAVAARYRMKGAVLAVTGSVGKTSTTEMLRIGFSALGPAHSPVGSFNNHWGVPLTLARMPEETRYGIFEIGMNHAGEIRPLTKLVRPHVAIVTTVGPVHLEFFESEAGIAEAKAEIFEGLEPGGAAF